MTELLDYQQRELKFYDDDLVYIEGVIKDIDAGIKAMKTYREFRARGDYISGMKQGNYYAYKRSALAALVEAYVAAEAWRSEIVSIRSRLEQNYIQANGQMS